MRPFSLLLLAVLLLAAPVRAASNVVVRLVGPVTDESATETEVALAAAVNSGAERIVLLINSPGGDVEAGERLAHEVEQVRVPLTCVVDGHADSIAFYLLQSCPVRVATRQSTLVTHEPFVGLHQALLHLDDAIKLVEELRDMVEQVGRHCAARMNITYEQYQERVHGKDWDMKPDEAVSVHALDRVVDSLAVGIAPLAETALVSPDELDY